MSSTTLGRRTLLWSTYSLGRTLLWVRRIFLIESIRNLSRVWAKHQNGSCGLCCLPWRALWTLSWIQHHLIPRDHLLDSCWHLQESLQQNVNENDFDHFVILMLFLTKLKQLGRLSIFFQCSNFVKIEFWNCSNCTDKLRWCSWCAAAVDALMLLIQCCS